MVEELFNTKLARNLESDEKFSGIFNELNNLTIRVELGFDYEKIWDYFIKIKELLEYWFIFASSQVDSHKKIALRVSYISFTLIERLNLIENFPDYKDILQLLLSRIWNNASIPLILWQSKSKVDYDKTLLNNDILSSSNIPIIEKISILNNVYKNKYYIDKENSIILNNNQTELLKLFDDFKYISFSWPTSFWKTFLLINYIIKQLIDSDKEKIFIFVLPTISLLTEIKSKIIKEVIKYNLINDTLISTNPKISDKDTETNHKNKIFIFTQERLNTFLVNYKDVVVDILIVDEAYNIEDSSRWVILLDSIKSIINNSYNTKIIFSSPLLDNPNEFFDIFNLKDEIFDIKINLSPVLQNTIWVYFNNTYWDISFYLHENNKKSEISLISLDNYNISTNVEADWELPQNIQSYAKMFEVMNSINIKWTTFIFVEAPKSMINLSKYMIKRLNIIDDLEIKEVSDFFKDFFHKDFSLAETIRYWVIYYFWDLPNIIKEKLSFLIDKWKIKYIISNQSLLQWVNFPIKNIVIKEKNDWKWISNKVTELDFKNLTWRAWRLLEDFSWNIFYFSFYNTKEIKEKNILDFHEHKKFFVKSSIEKLFLDEKELEKVSQIFLNKEENLFKSIDEYDKNNWKTLNYFILSEKSWNLEKEKEKLLNLKENEKNFEIISKIMTDISDLSINISLPLNLLEKNKFISFEFQNDFYKNLTSREENYIDKFILPKPWTWNFKEFSEKFRLVIWSLNKYFKLYNDKFLHKVTSKAIDYIYEKSFSEMILKDVKYCEDKNIEKSIDDIIDENLDIVRNSILFKLSSHISCLYDIINHFLEEKWKTNLIDFDLATYIDNWCYKPQTFEFMNLWLSRYSAIKLSRICPTEQEDYLLWLKNNKEKINDKNILWELKYVLDINK